MTVFSSANRWWQNWPKTHAYIARKMFFPKSADEVADAIQQAERDQCPVRAVGGGWSFSDASLPGQVETNRPKIHAVEALSALVPIAQRFPADPAATSVAFIPDVVPTPDVGGSLIMLYDHPNALPVEDTDWAYLGGGAWSWRGAPFTPTSPPGFLNFLASRLNRPVRATAGMCLDEADAAGSMVMMDLAVSATRPSRDWFYNGRGMWSVGVSGQVAPDQGNLVQLSYNKRLSHPQTPAAMNLSPRSSQAPESLANLLSRQPAAPAAAEPVYLVNTRSLVASLQQYLPTILSASAADATSSTPSGGRARRFLFHVEGGITIAELGTLLSHQSPRLSLQAISGSPGATLAGALSSATHGAEFNWSLLVDRVKAVHLVGPCGLQWWIEGSESIADPQKLLAAYPAIARERFIAGAAPVAGILPQDWLNAVVVSMGSLGVLYSVVLEVVPQFGVHEVVVEKLWKQMGLNFAAPLPELPTVLRSPATTQEASRRLVGHLMDGTRNGTGIPRTDAQGRPVNQYADLAINPAPRPDGDYDCWIGNRELTPKVPVDSQPSTASETADTIRGISMAFNAPHLTQKLRNIYGFGSDLDILGNLITYSGARAKLNRLTTAADLTDVALDTFLTPMLGTADGPALAQALLTGILSGLLGTANCARRSDKTGVSVGALGFPASGIMGTGIEIALAPADAFGFLQTEILDRVDPATPFFGYVSIRLCSKTQSLMGMQQFGDPTSPCSVMIEVVGYGNDASRQFIHDLQQRTVDRIDAGLDAMLHWGLENDLFKERHLKKIKALQEPTLSGMSKLDTFIAVRSLLHTPCASPSYVFDNRFTERLGLSTRINLEDPYDFGTVPQRERRSVILHFENFGRNTLQLVSSSVSGDFRAAPTTPATSGPPPNLELEVVSKHAAPGAEIQLRVTFIAEDPGAHAGVLTILTRSLNEPGSARVIRVGLHAIVEVFGVTLLDPTPAVLDLGAVPLGEYKIVPIVLRNEGTKGASFDAFVLSSSAAEPQIGVAIGTIGAGQTRSFTLTYVPTVVGPLETDLTLHFSDGITPSRQTQDVVIHVVATGVGIQAELSPAQVDFGIVSVGAESAPLPVLLRNIGQATLLVTSTTISADFRLASTRPSSVAAGQTAQIDLVFRPQHGGLLSSAFTVSSNSAQPPPPVLLRGVGLVQALLGAAPASLSFAGTPVGSQSGEQIVVVRSTGALPVQLGALGIVGVAATFFRVTGATHRPGAILSGEDRCEIRVMFSPQAPGDAQATLELAHDGTGSPLQVELHGHAVAAQGLAPSTTELDFGAVAVGVASEVREVVLTNVTAAPLRIRGLAIAGSAGSDFGIIAQGGAHRGALVEPGAKYTVRLSVRPSAPGLRLAELTTGADVPVVPVSLRAEGLAIVVEWSALQIEFNEWLVGAKSARREVNLRNRGNMDLVVTLVDAVGDFIVEDWTPQYMSLPPNGEKYFWVWFQPTAAGIREGTLRVHLGGSGSIQSLPLIGVGVPTP